MAAPQVCLTCKGRKKKCDKRLPRCSYCELNYKTCCYDYGGAPEALSPGRSDSTVATPPQLFPAISIGSIHDSQTLNSTVPLEVMQIIDATHRSIEDINSRYFSGLHLWIPFLCPDRFGKDLLQFHVQPTADFSLLLLCICLVTYNPSQHPSPPIGHDALYLHSKTLFTQIQALQRPSVRVIQAGMLIAVYEYARGQPDTALATIDLVARMAYRSGMNKKPTRLGWSEAWNTWWAIVMFERIFYCESTSIDIPLITAAPDGTDLLPHEVGNCDSDEGINPGFRVVPVGQAGVGCLGRAAQAVYLLDRVLQAVKAIDITTSDRVANLMNVDGELQRLLAVAMKKCHGVRGGHCGTVGVSIRALSILHYHILHLEAMANDSKWRNHSQAALDTVAQMTVDISRSHREIPDHNVDTISPACNYVLRHALQHIYERPYADSKAWFEDSDALRESLARVGRRWSMLTGIFSDTEGKTL